jgi:hypothetical protein
VEIARSRAAPVFYDRIRPAKNLRRKQAMTTRYAPLYTAVLLGTVAFAATSAQALTMQECSTKYKAAQSAGTLNGMTWNAFRKAQCGASAAAAPTATTGAAPSTTAAPPPPATAPAATGNAVFPTAVSPKYTQESQGKARMHTCLDQYNANKATNANGGMKWIQKGGGYYSECNKQLKG